MSSAAQIGLILGPLTDPLTGGLCTDYTVYFYAAGTSTPKNVWTEKDKTNPFTSYSLGASGMALLYGDGWYKIVVKNLNSDTVISVDNVWIQNVTHGLLASYANNAAAIAGGLSAGDLYRIGDTVGVVH